MDSLFKIAAGMALQKHLQEAPALPRHWVAVVSSLDFLPLRCSPVFAKVFITQSKSPVQEEWHFHLSKGFGEEMAKLLFLFFKELVSRLYQASKLLSPPSPPFPSLPLFPFLSLLFLFLLSFLSCSLKIMRLVCTSCKQNWDGTREGRGR